MNKEIRAAHPPIHRSHWGWLIIAYFFLGGIAGAAQSLASLATLVGRGRLDRMVRLARYISFLSFLPCPPLLILDLRRPARFVNMLRVLKLRSPMSIGSWLLLLFGGVAAANAAIQAGIDGCGKPTQRDAQPAQPGRWATTLAIVGLPSGLLLAGYTGVLLAATAVPLWTRRALLLGPLFLASACSSAVATIELAGQRVNLPRSERDALHRLGQSIATVEALVLVVWVSLLGRAGHSVANGNIGRWLQQGVAGLGIAIPALLSLAAYWLPTRLQNHAELLRTAATLTGGFALRAVVVFGGNRSADDPGATFELTANRSDRSDNASGNH